jgi:hypothetical protein
MNTNLNPNARAWYPQQAMAMRSNLNPNASAWYPPHVAVMASNLNANTETKCLNTDYIKQERHLKNYIHSVIPSKETLLYTQGTVGQSPARNNTDGRELSPSIPRGTILNAEIFLNDDVSFVSSTIDSDTSLPPSIRRLPLFPFF